MPLQWSRYTALIFALGLGVGEAVINWGHWQFAPLWIVDYICVAWLVAGFYQTRGETLDRRSIAVLASGWAFTAGVFYMALFISLDPGMARYNINVDRVILIPIGLMLILAALGVVTSFLALRKSKT
jgi:hypothetical protein